MEGLGDLDKSLRKQFMSLKMEDLASRKLSMAATLASLYEGAIFFGR
jgi:hypothetical protein